MERKLLAVPILIGSTLSSLLSLSVHGEERIRQSLVRDVAKILEYPEKRLEIIDLSEKWARKNEGFLNVFVVQSKDRTFAKLSLALSKSGILLTPEIEAQCRAASLKDPSEVERVELGGDAYAYSGLSLAGPGGTETRFFGTFPSKGIDMHIKVTIPGDPPLNVDDETGNYHRLIVAGGADLQKRMLLVFSAVLTHFDRAEVKISASDSQSNTTAGAQASLLHSEPSATEPRDFTLPVHWILIVAAIMVGVLGIVVLRRRA